MAEITLQNTKAEIFAAYEAERAANLHLSENLIKYQEELNNTNENFKNLTESFSKSQARIIELENKITEDPDFKECIEDLTLQIAPKTSVVIPYVKGLAQGNELQLAVRGWAKNFREEMNIVIIGDREDWMSDLVHVIECERISNNPPLDVVNKMMLAIDSDQVSEKFIWANDDQYLVSPCMLADFEFLKCVGRLGEMKFGNSLYQQNKVNTAALLLKENLPTIDFSIHVPVVFEKTKLKIIIEKFGLTENPLLVNTIYHNYWFPGFVPLKIDTPEMLELDNLKVGVYRQGADLERLKKLIPRKKLVSNSESGWSQKLSEILNSFFSFKCKFEN